MSEFTPEIFPIKELSSQNLTAALNNLHDRLKLLEEGFFSLSQAGPLDTTILSATDRAVLDHAAGFFGVHATVAETLASKAAGVTDIDPTTGKARVIVERPEFQKVELQQTGS